MNGPCSIAMLNYQRVSINTNSQVASSKVSLQRGWSPTIIWERVNPHGFSTSFCIPLTGNRNKGSAKPSPALPWSLLMDTWATATSDCLKGSHKDCHFGIPQFSLWIQGDPVVPSERKWDWGIIYFNLDIFFVASQIVFGSIGFE